MARIVLPDKFTFPEIVKGLSKNGNKAIPLNINSDILDQVVVSEIYNEIKSLIRGKTGIKIKGKMRINDINENIMDTIIVLLRKNKNLGAPQIQKLLMNSYADIKMIYPNGIYYIELICTTKTELKGDTLRGIYLSSLLRNIDSDGKHILILLTFEMDEIKKVFYPKLVRQYDLYNVGLNLKIEYSASLNDINNLGVL